MAESKDKHKAKTTLNHDSVVADWRAHAERNDEANYRFLRSLKYRRYGFDPDEAAAELHQQAFQIVDCTRCANCCKTMMIMLEETDIDRLAAHFQMTQDEFAEAYLEHDEEDDRWHFRQRPCPFLQADDRCSIYEVRPTCCREYPYTDREGFIFRSIGHATNAMCCPAVFWIVEELRQRAAKRKPY